MIAVVQRQPTMIVRLVEWRCPRCGRLLGRVMLGPRSIVEIKCEKCGAVVERRAG